MTAFEFRDDNVVIPPGFTEIKCHLVFDVKMDLTRKASFVAGGHHMTDPPKDSTYSSVVTSERVCSNCTHPCCLVEQTRPFDL